MHVNCRSEQSMAECEHWVVILKTAGLLCCDGRENKSLPLPFYSDNCKEVDGTMNKQIKAQVRFVLEDDNEYVRATLEPHSHWYCSINLALGSKTLVGQANKGNSLRWRDLL